MTSTEVGKNYPAEKLLQEFDAVVLCGGATKPRDLPVEGRELKGIHFADGIPARPTPATCWAARCKMTKTLITISARGKDVIVIGGGDTGTDCVGTSLRHGCRSLVQFEILERPPHERQPDNPWPEWPKVFKVDYGQEEAAAIYGQDPRQYSIQTKRFVGDEQGQVKEIHTVQVEWVTGANGRLAPREIPGTEKVWPAQLVLLAMGFLGPEDQLLNSWVSSATSAATCTPTIGRYTTSVPGVFSAGDMRRGQSLVVWAIHEGRGAAREVDRYLMGETQIP